MKTSLICLLLLAAVACAAPKAEGMRGGKRAEISEKMREKMAEKRKEIAEKMRERAEENGGEMAEKRKEMAEKIRERAEEKREKMAEEKREESEKLVAVAKSDEKAEARSSCLYIDEPCYTDYGEIGCYYDYCNYEYDILFFDYHFYCYCCSDSFAPYCSLRRNYYY